MTRVLAALSACIACAVTGCFDPALDGFACGPAGECPQGYECSVDNQCVVPGQPGDVDSGLPPGGDRQGPQAAISFPLPVGTTEAATIAVRGTASDESGIRAIRVNGTPVNSNNGFLDWQVNVPLAPGMNVLLVETEDLLGNVDRSAASAAIRQTSRLLINPSGVAVSPDGTTGVAWDRAGRTLVSLDLASGERTVVADNGAGGLLFNAAHLAVTPGGEALAVDTGQVLLAAVNLGTGESRRVSGQGSGSGEDLLAPVGLTLNPTGDVAFVGDNTKKVLFAIDVAMGARTVVSGLNAAGVTVGAGPTFQTITAMAFDAANTGVLVVDSGLQALIGVENDDGDRVVLSSASKGSGPDLVQPVGVAASPDGNVAYVLDAGLGAVLVIDIKTGDRTVISGMGEGSGLPFRSIESMAVHPDLTRAFVVDNGALVPVVVDLQTGERILIEPVDVGSGTAIVDPESLALDPARKRLVVADDGLDGLLVVDLATGDRTLLPDNAAVPLENPESVAVHPDGVRAVVVDSTTDSCVTVNLDTGERTLVSSEDRGTGPLMDAPEAMALNAAGTLALVADLTPALFSVDLLTGERTLVSGDGNASDFEFRDPTAILFDEARNRALVADPGVRRILSVDLGTGVRTDLAGDGPVLRFVEGMALTGTPDRALIYEGENAVYLFVDLATGNRTMATTAELRDAASFGSPEVLTVDRANNVLLVADIALRAVIAIDLATGERLIVSR